MVLVNPSPLPKGNPSLLVSQVGYHPNDIKQAFLRAPTDFHAEILEECSYQIIDEESQSRVFTGFLHYWGAQWNSHWWTLDFSLLRTEGHYFLSLICNGRTIVSKSFRIGEAVFIEESLVTVALDQLDARLETVEGSADRPGITAWRDCGNVIGEISSYAVTLHALADLYDRQEDRLTFRDKQRTLEAICFGSDYIVKSQIRSSDLNQDGLFEHDLLHFTYLKHPPDFRWVVWHDAAYVITALARACQVLRKRIPEKYEEYLVCAQKAWATAVRRPYNLESELGGPGGQAADRMNELMQLYYNKPLSWKAPLTLRTKSLLTFLWANTLLYDLTGERRYLDTALSFADQAVKRQHQNWRCAIDGVFGNFFEFEDDHSAFLTEYGHSHGWLMGNIEPTNLKGFIDLIRITPDHPKSAQWSNLLYTYGECYAKAAARLNPLGIYPVAVYRDEKHGGVKFFQVILHGATCLYGQIAKNLLELGAFLQDSSYQQLAAANVQFVLGLNPGIPESQESTTWEAKSLLKNVGANSFQGSRQLWDDSLKIKIAPPGSGFNGFSAFPQFSEHYLCEAVDSPNGIHRPDGGMWFNEDYLPHSHGYVSGICLLEDCFHLEVMTYDRGRPVDAKVRVGVPNGFACNTGPSGVFTTNRVPTQRKGVLSASYRGVVISRPLETLSGATLNWKVDFASHVEASLVVPPLLSSRQVGEARLSLTNIGHSSSTVQGFLSSDGVRVSPTQFTINLQPNVAQEVLFKVCASDLTTNYLVRASVNSKYSSHTYVGRGRVDGVEEGPLQLPSSEKYCWEFQKSLWRIGEGIIENTRQYYGPRFKVMWTYKTEQTMTLRGRVCIRSGQSGGLIFSAKSCAEAFRPPEGYAAVIDAKEGLFRLLAFPWMNSDLFTIRKEFKRECFYELAIQWTRNKTGMRIIVSVDQVLICDYLDEDYKHEGNYLGVMVDTSQCVFSNMRLSTHDKETIQGIPFYPKI